MLKKLLVLTTLVLSPGAAPADTIELTDLAGRKVQIERPVQRIILGEGRYIPLLALLRPDNPVEGVVGMMSTLGYTDPGLEKQLFEKFPAARAIPLFGSGSGDSVSPEKIIALAPQVAIFGLGDHGPGARNAELMQLLERAGIKIVFIDFRQDPLQNTLPSIALLGELLGAQAKATDYIDFYSQRLALIRERAAKATNRPRTFVQAHPGRFECCWGMADGMLGPIVGLVGGTNIADAAALGPTAQHSAEFLLTENPDVWIGTASGTPGEYQAGKTPVALGDGITPAMAADSLGRYLTAPEIKILGAVQKGRAHSIWHSFYNSPFNIVAIEAFAKWIQPELFADLDPQATLEQINSRYAPLKLQGTYFATHPAAN
ncbi:ABC transporter substrate-binding protein [Lacibacterium aquatile]|uniref:ABC transporter substrate-binding protein n=1 Tax=Lacibacterium aquatile TaxID=1168082 RepID=A0ABW5DSQ7_9PROT